VVLGKPEGKGGDSLMATKKKPVVKKAAPKKKK
jgi:hypothetical protein